MLSRFQPASNGRGYGYPKPYQCGGNRSVQDAVVLQVVGVGQASGQSIGSRSVLDLQVLDLPADNVVGRELELLVAKMHDINNIGRVDGKAGLKFGGGESDE